MSLFDLGESNTMNRDEIVALIKQAVETAVPATGGPNKKCDKTLMPCNLLIPMVELAWPIAATRACL